MEARLQTRGCSSSDLFSSVDPNFWIKPRLLASSSSYGDCRWVGMSLQLDKAMKECQCGYYARILVNIDLSISRSSNFSHGGKRSSPPQFHPHTYNPCISNTLIPVSLSDSDQTHRQLSESTQIQT
ncbi:hypothetical protein M0R45_019227 [Rubus argutus]|uniref:Uncharacterized protein n=1 Tax=Rubus argutus TaxID=59490 RepID=A0AAW1X6R0_RUBAR